MATRTEVMTYCDFTGEPGAETIEFGIDGKAYTVDCNEKKAEELRWLLAPFIEAARRISQTGLRQRPGRSAAVRDNSAAVIRVWALAHGYSVGPRGRVPREVRGAYDRRLASG